MRFYHLSSTRLATLIPTIGSSRHGGEDPRAVGKAVVWLSNDASMRRTDSDGNHAPYQHEVELDAADPDLFIDEPFDALMKQADAMFGHNSPQRWYFYPKPLEVIAVRQWNQASGRYE